MIKWAEGVYFQGEMWSRKQCHHTHCSVQLSISVYWAKQLCWYAKPRVEQLWPRSFILHLQILHQHMKWATTAEAKNRQSNTVWSALWSIGGDATTANKLGGLKSISLHNLTQSKDQISLKQTVTSRAKWHWHLLIILTNIGITDSKKITCSGSVHLD